MKTSIHSIFSIILAVILYPIFGWKVELIVAGGVLIDVDHYLWYIYKYNNLNLLDCYRHYLNRMDRKGIMENIGILLLFHTIEFFLLMAILSLYVEEFFIFTIGLIAHYFLDLIYLYYVPKRFIANHSVISWIIANKIQKV